MTRLHGKFHAINTKKCVVIESFHNPLPRLRKGPYFVVTLFLSAQPKVTNKQASCAYFFIDANAMMRNQFFFLESRSFRS